MKDQKSKNHGTLALIDDFRARILPILGGGDILLVSAVPFVSSGRSYLRKIPPQNYENLGRLVPINWL